MITTDKFYFSGNQAWGWYPEDWERIKAVYKEERPDLDLRSAMADERTLLPNEKGHFKPIFGFYIEHSGPTTLGRWMQIYGLPFDIRPDH